MNLQIISTLIKKDIALYLRNLFFPIISLLSLVIYALVYWLMPSAVTQEFTVAVYPAEIPAEIRPSFESRDIELLGFDTFEAMQAAVETGEYRAGLTVTKAMTNQLLAGEDITIQAIYPAGIPAELNAAFTDFLQLIFNEVAYRNDEFHVNRIEETLGHDLSGKALAPRDRMLPLFALLIFMTETMGLATLIAEEVQRGTIKALLITPLDIKQLFIGKSITGVLLAFVQTALLMVITGSLAYRPELVIVTLILGALLVTGVGFLIASLAKDMMSVISWSTLAILLLGMPSVSIMFPGTISDWVKVIPSYYLVDTLHRIINFDAVWTDVSVNLMIMLLTGITLLSAGSMALGRKVSS